MHMRPLLLCAAAIGAALVTVCPGQTLLPGDLVFSQDGAGSGANNAVFNASPVTGDRTIISPPAMGNPTGLFRTSSGDFWVLEANLDTIFFVSADTGNRTIISGNGAGSGPDFDGTAIDVVQLPNGDLAAEDSHRVLRINPITGA